MRRPSNLMKSTAAPETRPAPADPASPANYLDLYGLSKPPFSGTSDSGGYILFASHRRTFEPLAEHAVSGSGTLLLQGEEGIGKTETLRALATVAAESGVRPILLARPSNGRISLIQLVSALDGKPSADDDTAEATIERFLAPPRKALLIDDVDLMPADCVRFLNTLTRRIPADPGGPAIVLTTSTDLALDARRPELAQLVGLARNILRLPPLSIAEVRQYIERSLWIAGGTTRRLIAPDAIKLVVAQSSGVPGITNRLMDAVLTAGFARGDSMINAKTVNAAMGPPAPRPRPRQPPRPSKPEWSAIPARAIQTVGIGLLVLGAAAFLYRGLSGPVDRETPAATKPTTSRTSSAPMPSASPRAGLGSETSPIETLPPDVTAALMKRGDQSLGLGDIAAARLLYRRAADAGNAAAATALGRTYDPNFVSPGTNPDLASAATSYRRAIVLGDPRAADLLKRLGLH